MSEQASECVSMCAYIPQVCEGDRRSQIVIPAVGGPCRDTEHKSHGMQ